MNKSFENIFEKYNIKCESYKTSRKRLQNPKQLFKFNKNLNNLSVDDSSAFSKGESTCGNALSKINFCNTSKNLNSICCNSTNQSKILNSRTSLSFKSTRRKYSNEVRTKPLDLVVVQKQRQVSNLQKDQTFSEGSSTVISSNKTTTESESLNTIKCTCYGSIDSSRFRKDSQGSMEKLPFTCSFNLNSVKCRSRPTKLSQFKPLDIKHLPKRNNINIIEHHPVENEKSISKKLINNFDLSAYAEDYLCETFDPFLSNYLQPSKLIDSLISTQKSDEKNRTELDLLIDLIEQDERKKKSWNGKRYKEKQCKSKILKGGYEELFHLALKRETVKGRFLKYDRKFVLQSGILLTVMELETSYGVTFATVKSEIYEKSFGIVVGPDMASLLTSGTQIEAFFSDSTVPYKLQINDEVLDVYLEPYKLLIV